MLEKYSVERFSALCDAGDFTASCVDVPKFLGFCRECPNYGNNWMCPPFDFDPMTIWSSCGKIRLTVVRIKPEGESAASAEERALKIIGAEKRKLLLELLDEEKRIRGGVSCSAGSCDLCEKCARTEGKPCRNPQMARHSIESLGADVSIALKKYLGLEISWIKEGKMPEYLTLAAALLLPKENDATITSLRHRSPLYLPR